MEEWTLAEHLLSNVIVVGQVRFPTRKVAALVRENAIRAEKYVELRHDLQARALGRENERGEFVEKRMQPCRIAEALGRHFLPKAALPLEVGAIQLRRIGACR